MASQGISISKEEKDGFLQQKMEAIRKKNEEILRRHAEVEADKRNADMLSSMHSTKKQPSTQPTVIENKSSSSSNSFSNKPRRIHHPVDEVSRTKEIEERIKQQRLTTENGPPPDPVNFLADQYWDSGDTTHVNNRNSRRHYSNYGGQNFQNVKYTMQEQKKYERRTYTVNNNPVLVMTGKERKDYENWKAERQKIDEERIARQLTSSGMWKREWDMNKVEQEEVETQKSENQFFRQPKWIEAANNQDRINKGNQGSRNRFNVTDNDSNMEANTKRKDRAVILNEHNSLTIVKNSAFKNEDSSHGTKTHQDSQFQRNQASRRSFEKKFNFTSNEEDWNQDKKKSDFKITKVNVQEDVIKDTDNRQESEIFKKENIVVWKSDQKITSENWEIKDRKKQSENTTNWNVGLQENNSRKQQYNQENWEEDIITNTQFTNSKTTSFSDNWEGDRKWNKQQKSSDGWDNGINFSKTRKGSEGWDNDANFNRIRKSSDGKDSETNFNRTRKGSDGWDNDTNFIRARKGYDGRDSDINFNRTRKNSDGQENDTTFNRIRKRYDEKGSNTNFNRARKVSDGWEGDSEWNQLKDNRKFENEQRDRGWNKPKENWNKKPSDGWDKNNNSENLYNENKKKPFFSERSKGGPFHRNERKMDAGENSGKGGWMYDDTKSKYSNQRVYTPSDHESNFSNKINKNSFDSEFSFPKRNEKQRFEGRGRSWESNRRGNDQKYSRGRGNRGNRQADREISTRNEFSFQQNKWEQNKKSEDTVNSNKQTSLSENWTIKEKFTNDGWEIDDTQIQLSSVKWEENTTSTENWKTEFINSNAGESIAKPLEEWESNAVFESENQQGKVTLTDGESHDDSWEDVTTSGCESSELSGPNEEAIHKLNENLCTQPVNSEKALIKDELLLTNDNEMSGNQNCDIQFEEGYEPYENEDQIIPKTDNSNEKCVLEKSENSEELNCEEITSTINITSINEISCDQKCEAEHDDQECDLNSNEEHIISKADDFNLEIKTDEHILKETESIENDNKEQSTVNAQNLNLKIETSEESENYQIQSLKETDSTENNTENGEINNEQNCDEYNSCDNEEHTILKADNCNLETEFSKECISEESECCQEKYLKGNDLTESNDEMSDKKCDDGYIKRNEQEYECHNNEECVISNKASENCQEHLKESSAENSIINQMNFDQKHDDEYIECDKQKCEYFDDKEHVILTADNSSMEIEDVILTADNSSIEIEDVILTTDKSNMEIEDDVILTAILTADNSNMEIEDVILTADNSSMENEDDKRNISEEAKNYQELHLEEMGSIRTYKINNDKNFECDEQEHDSSISEDKNIPKVDASNLEVKSNSEYTEVSENLNEEHTIEISISEETNTNAKYQEIVNTTDISHTYETEVHENLEKTNLSQEINELNFQQSDKAVNPEQNKNECVHLEQNINNESLNSKTTEQYSSLHCEVSSSIDSCKVTDDAKSCCTELITENIHNEKTERNTSEVVQKNAKSFQLCNEKICITETQVMNNISNELSSDDILSQTEITNISQADDAKTIEEDTDDNTLVCSEKSSSKVIHESISDKNTDQLKCNDEKQTEIICNQKSLESKIQEIENSELIKNDFLVQKTVVTESTTEFTEVLEVTASKTIEEDTDDNTLVCSEKSSSKVIHESISDANIDQLKCNDEKQTEIICDQKSPESKIQESEKSELIKNDSLVQKTVVTESTTEFTEVLEVTASIPQRTIIQDIREFSSIENFDCNNSIKQTEQNSDITASNGSIEHPISK